MKPLHIQIIFFISAFFFATVAFAQSSWKLTKNKDGIAVYQSSSANSDYKSIKVECTLAGNYDKLIAVISNVSGHKNWVYNNKTASRLLMGQGSVVSV